MKKSFGFKLVVGAFLFLAILNACLLPCSVRANCAGGTPAWCETFGHCMGNELCTTTNTGVACECGGASAAFDCPFINVQ